MNVNSSSAHASPGMLEINARPWTPPPKGGGPTTPPGAAPPAFATINAVKSREPARRALRAPFRATVFRTRTPGLPSTILSVCPRGRINDAKTVVWLFPCKFSGSIPCVDLVQAPASPYRYRRVRKLRQRGKRARL